MPVGPPAAIKPLALTRRFQGIIGIALRGDGMLILGIDTSCDDTSCAVVRDGRQLLSNIVSSQTDLHAKFGGLCLKSLQEDT